MRQVWKGEAANQDLSWYVSKMNDSKDIEINDENHVQAEDCYCLDHDIAIRI